MLERMTASRWLTAAAFIGTCIFLPGCGPGSDDQQFRAAVQKVHSGQSNKIDVASFPKVADKDLQALQDAGNLQTLLLDSSQITDDGLKQLPALPQLTHLSLSRTHVTDAGMEPLTRLNNLEVLRLDRTRVRDAGMQQIANMPQLRDLSLWKCGVTDQGVAALAKLTSLERLSLDETLVTDAGIKQLQSLPRLKYLSVWHTNVTDEGASEFQKAKPDVNIHR